MPSRTTLCPECAREVGAVPRPRLLDEPAQYRVAQHGRPACSGTGRPVPVVAMWETARPAGRMSPRPRPSRARPQAAG